MNFCHALVLALCLGLGSHGVCAAASFADPNKTLRVSMDGEEAGFDPQGVADAYSLTVMGAIFEPLYQYDYYGGARIVPRTAAGPPEISAEGERGSFGSSPPYASATIPRSKVPHAS